MQKERPVNLDLTKFSFPPMAIISVMHRMAGVVLFLLLPLLLYILQAALASPASYAALCLSFHTPVFGVLTWCLLASACFHLLAGIRHLFMDFGLGETARSGRVTAYTVLILWAVSVIGMGVRLW